MNSKLLEWLTRRPSLAGTSLPERILSTTFAILGLAVAAGLGFVALFSQPGFPILSMGPLPSPPAGHEAVEHGFGLSAGPGASAVAPAGTALSTLPWPGSATASPMGTGEGGPLGALVLPALAAGHAAGAGAGQPGDGGGGSQQASPSPVITPAQPPVAEPESIPVSTPVSGSSSSSGLFVRSSVGKGDGGTISEGSPVSSPEPEVPVEPSPEPEVPVEPSPEPEVPVESSSDPEASPPAPPVS